MKTLTSSVFEQATQSTVKTLGRDVGVRVIFSGDKARNNGNEIFLPKMAESAVINEHDAEIVRGYADHETLHSLMTDFGETTEAKKKAGPLLSALMNAVEDIRIEHGGLQLYDGMGKHISAVAEATAVEAVKSASEEDLNNWKAALPIATTWAGRMMLGTAGDNTKESFAKLGDDVQRKAEALAKAILTLDTGCEKGFLEKDRALEGCRQGASLANRVFNDLKQEEEESKGKGKGEGTVSPGGSDEAEEGGSSGSGSSGSEGGDSDAATAGAGGGIGGGESHHGEEAAIEDRVIDPSFDGSANHIFKRLAETALDKGAYNVITKENDVVITRRALKEFTGKPADEQREALGSFYTRKDADTLISDGMARYKQVIDSMGSTVGVMKRKLERALLAKERRFYESGFSSGKFDSRRALNVVLGQSNVFKRKTHGFDLNTAVTILVDLSGSMHGTKSALAMKTCIALTEALEKTNVAYEVLGFRTGADNDYDDKAVVVKKVVYARRDALEGFVFKGFNENLKQARWFLGYIQEAVGGANADGESVRWAAERLLEKRAKRHVMMVLSDGEPSCSSDSTGLLHQHLRDTVKWCQSKDIEMVGLGILSTAVKQFYDNHIYVKSLDCLTKTVIDQLGKLLVGDGFKADNSELISGDAKRVKKA